MVGADRVRGDDALKTEKDWRNDVLRRMKRLADKRANDAVKLAFLKEGELDGVDGMDLGCLTELKRHNNGAVEIKLVNRVEALEKLFEMAGEGGEEAEAFFRALKQSADAAQEGEQTEREA